MIQKTCLLVSNGFHYDLIYRTMNDSDSEVFIDDMDEDIDDDSVLDDVSTLGCGTNKLAI